MPFSSVCDDFKMIYSVMVFIYLFFGTSRFVEVFRLVLLCQFSFLFILLLICVQWDDYFFWCVL